MENEAMKEKVRRWSAVTGIVLILAGCGAAAKESGFYEHNTMYRDWDHFIFSVYGYKKPDPKIVSESKAQEWWGITIEEPMQ
jgi:hypothetical protein